jgi:2-oxoglutarate ferredoxin oxidoreductase subunit alpha
VLSYGSTSKVVDDAIKKMREEGIKVGNLRLITVWPFPDKKMRELAQRVKAFVVPEINYGQIVYEVERSTHGEKPIVFVPRGWGNHESSTIVSAIKQALDIKQCKGVINYASA